MGETENSMTGVHKLEVASHAIETREPRFPVHSALAEGYRELLRNATIRAHAGLTRLRSSIARCS
jgi:hypothetical protein